MRVCWKELHEQNEALEEENKRLHKLYEHLVLADELRKKADDGLTDAKTKVEKLQNENTNLWQYFNEILFEKRFNRSSISWTIFV